MKHIKPLIVILAAAAVSSPRAATVFDNGISSGPQTRIANDLSQRLYDNFSLTSDTIISGFSWQQHDDVNMGYVATRVSIYGGLPEVSTLLFTADLVATRTPNATGTIFGTFNGFDYSVGGLSLALPAGTFWLGLNTIYQGASLGSGWDATLGGPDTIVGARIINDLNPPPGKTDTVPDFAFQVNVAPKPATLLANYTFDGTAADGTGNSPPVDLRNTTFTNGTLCLNGIYELDNPEGFHASASITGFSYESFTVALDFFAADFSRNNILTGGSSYRWFSLRHNAGRLEVTLNNQALVYLIPNSQLKTNEWQSLICSVNASTKKIISALDGQRLADIDLSLDFKFEVIGSPAESTDRLFTFVNYSNGSVFHGYVDNLKVWSRALNSSEIDAMLSTPTLAIQRAVIVSWPKFPQGYVLRSSTNVNGPYQDYTGSIFTEANQLNAAVTLGSAQKYFQLYKP